MRVVLDTNVVASALLWSGVPRLLLQAGREKRLNIFSSTPLLAELTDILNRRKFEKKIAASQLSVDQLVDRYMKLITIVRPVFVPRIATDPDDDVVIGTALAAKAELIVSGDAHLLDLKHYQGMPIVTAAEAVRRMTKT